MQIHTSTIPRSIQLNDDLMEARVDALNDALAELVRRVYEVPGTVDPDSGRILAGAPMGRKGAQDFGLVPQEREVLRVHLLGKAGLRPRGPWLFYDESMRAWFVDLATYPTADHARGWLERHGVALWQWRVALSA